MRSILTVIIAVLIAAAAYFSVQYYDAIMFRKDLKEDLAEINKVNYELFNLEIWKDQALGIFQQRIKDFEISEETYVVLDKQVREYLHRMYREQIESGKLIDMILTKMEEGGKINKMFLKLIKSNVDEQIQDLNLKGQIPVLSRQVTAEIKRNEPLLKSYLQQELLRLVIDDANQVKRDRRAIIYNKYEKVDQETTEQYLTDKIDEINTVVKGKQNYVIFALLAALILCVVLIYQETRWGIAAMTVLSVILLVLGITLPMIDIDARLESFVFELMGAPISFDEQVVYFQSKSIVEVTKTLWTSGGADLKVVGGLVFLFSIVFPFFKLLLSTGYLFTDRIRSSSWAQTVIFHLGKWSMADVFVVAIFMAYIGMYGVISSQLNGISSSDQGFLIETINYSNLSPGAFFFLAYTILSIIISILINRKSAELG